LWPFALQCSGHGNLWTDSLASYNSNKSEEDEDEEVGNGCQKNAQQRHMPALPNTLLIAWDLEGARNVTYNATFENSVRVLIS